MKVRQICYLNDAWKAELSADLASPECEIDPGMMEAVRRINRLPHIATTQCCDGHDGQEGYISVTVDRHEADRGFFQRMAATTLPDAVRMAKLFEPCGETVRVRYVFWFEPDDRETFLHWLLEIVHMCMEEEAVMPVSSER